MVTSVPVLGRKLAGGDVVIDSFPNNVAWLQVDAECSATPAAGKLYLKFKTPHMSTAKSLLDDQGNAVYIDLTKPYPYRVEDILISSLILSPSSDFDADKTFSVGVSWGV